MKEEVLEKLRVMTEDNKEVFLTKVIESAIRLEEFLKNKEHSTKTIDAMSENTVDEIVNIIHEQVRSLQVENESLKKEMSKLKQQVESIDSLKSEVAILKTELSKEKAKMAEVLKEKAENDKKLEKMQLYWERHVARS